MDLFDVTSGGSHEKARIKYGPKFQVPLSEAIKKAHGDKLLVGAVGVITNGTSAQEILDEVRLTQCPGSWKTSRKTCVC